MLEQISLKIANNWSDKKIIPEEDTDIYRYGIEIGLSTMVNTLCLLITTLLFFNILDLIIFLSFFIILRQFTGGYHADTYIKCNLVTVSCYALSTLLANYVHIDTKAISALFAVGLVLIGITAPINNCNKTITKAQAGRYKAMAIIVFVLETAITYAMLLFNSDQASNAFFTILCIIILMPIGMILNKRKENA